MPRWDDPRRDHERDGWRGDQQRGESHRDERRSFGQDAPRGRLPQEPWRGERNAARYDQDRMGYGRRDDDAASRASARHHDDRRGQDTGLTRSGEPWAYGGQEYGMETHGGFSGGGGGARPGAGWELGRDSERRRNFDLDDPGAGQSPAGYGAYGQPQQGGRAAGQGRADERRPDHDLDPDYLRWRDEQLRAHDREYQDWRRDQMRRYDEQYRQFRQERQNHFGRAFHEWRAQRSASPGVDEQAKGKPD